MKPGAYKKTKSLNVLLSWLMKWAVAVAAFAYIIYDIYNHVQLHDSLSLYKTCLSDRALLWITPLVLALIMANWTLEVVKWRRMMQKISLISFRRAFSAIFTGLTISFFTPNRVGEYAGRVLFLNKSERIKGIFVTILCSFSQLLVTIVAGLVCMVFYMKRFFADENPLIYYIFISLLLIVTGLVLLLYFNIHVLDWLCKKWHVSRKITRYTRVFSYFDTLQLAKLLGLSALRYCTFCLQFYIVLHVFHVDAPFFNIMEMLALTYLTIAVVPTFALTEIGVRGSASLYFLGTLSGNSLGILTASLTVWITNIALPSAIGAICILYLRINK